MNKFFEFVYKIGPWSLRKELTLGTMVLFARVLGRFEKIPIINGNLDSFFRQMGSWSKLG